VVSALRPKEEGGVRDFLEPWLTIDAAADYWGCSQRTIKYALAEGMPHKHVLGRPKILAGEAEPWLIATGKLTDPPASVTVGSTEETAPAGNRGLTTGGEGSNG
jgi:hypothetical protein